MGLVLITFLCSAIHNAFAFGIERNDGDRIPVTRVPRPSPGIGFSRPSVKLVPAGQDATILASMTLSGAHVANGAVAMLMVVPGDELANPTASGIQVGKTLTWELRPIFGGAEE